MRRAAHQLYDDPVVFEDPLAFRVLSDEAAARVRNGAEDENGTAWARGLRAFVATRSRFAEEELAAAVQRGVRQYVVLGAGLDTFAYRNSLDGLQVFEVDHPATQQWKRERLAHAGIAIPDSLRFAPVDFERQTLLSGLEAAGFAREKPAFFSWLGVVPYLTATTVMTTLTLIGGLPQGSGVVFDYSVPRELMGEAERRAFEFLAERVARAGEPFRSFFVPEELAEQLRTRGFTAIEDLDGTAIRARWFGPRQQEQGKQEQGQPEQRQPEQRLHGRSGHLLCAWV